MKFIKLDLLTLLISLFLFASCESTNSIGLDIDPEDAISGDLVDTLTIGSKTLKDEATQTLGLARYPLGYLTDPIFGTSEASIAMAVNLPNDAYDFGTDVVLDSAVLVMKFSSQFYGDSTNSTYSIDVRQLDDNLSAQTSFLSTKEWAASGTVVGNKTGKFTPNTKVLIDSVVVGKADTAVHAGPQLRIRLNNAFIQDQIVNLDSTTLKYNEKFTRSFRGLKVSLNKTESTGTGGIAFFDFNGNSADNTPNSKLELYYKRSNATTTTNTDTIAVSFPVSPAAASIKHDYTGTEIETQLGNPDQQYQITYLQGLGGLRNKISFPYISKLRETLGKVIVNKAQLVIDLSSGTDVSPFVPAPRLALYRNDIAERRQNVPDNDVATEANPMGDPRALTDPKQFGGYYDPINKRYIFILTAYVQDLLEGKTEDYGTFLSTTPTTEFNISPSVSAAARSVIGSFGNANNKIKLNIYYTKIKE